MWAWLQTFRVVLLQPIVENGQLAMYCQYSDGLGHFIIDIISKRVV